MLFQNPKKRQAFCLGNINKQDNIDKLNALIIECNF